MRQEVCSIFAAKPVREGLWELLCQVRLRALRNLGRPSGVSLLHRSDHPWRQEEVPLNSTTWRISSLPSLCELLHRLLDCVRGKRCMHIQIKIRCATFWCRVKFLLLCLRWYANEWIVTCSTYSCLCVMKFMQMNGLRNHIANNHTPEVFGTLTYWQSCTTSEAGPGWALKCKQAWEN